MIGWFVVLAAFVGMIVVLSREHRRRQSRTVEEFERDVKYGPGSATAMLRGGFGELDKALAPSQAVIAETLEAERRRSEADGEGDDPDSIERWRRSTR